MLRQTSKEAKGFGLRSFLFSCVISLIIITLVALIMAIVAFSSEDSTALTAPYALVTIVASGLISGFIGSRISGIKRALLCSLMVALVMLIIGIAVSKSAPGAGAFMNYGCYLLTSLMGAYLGRKRDGKKKRRHRH